MNLEQHNITWGKIICKIRVGSHAYGTNIEGSDEDFAGIFIQSPEAVIANRGFKKAIIFNDDHKYFELGDFLDNCIKGSPNSLELLFAVAPNILHTTPEYELLRKHRDMFLTKRCKWSFGGYARQQISKAQGLAKKMNWEKEKTERKTPLDFCKVIVGSNSYPLKQFADDRFIDLARVGISKVHKCPSNYVMVTDPYEEYNFKGLLNKKSNELKLSSLPKEVTDTGETYTLYYNTESYSSHCKDYKEYQEWLEKRNVLRYVNIEEHGQGYDGKNLLHCIRLIGMGNEIASKGTVTLMRPDAQELIDIRLGNVDLESIYKSAEDKLTKMDENFESCTLPEKVSAKRVRKLENGIRTLKG